LYFQESNSIVGNYYSVMRVVECFTLVHALPASWS